ncbi:MAG: hypothetical protein F6K47_27935 [Symploca sp. SIO2E6]|nr:hypothetical protein [Symploca sp. SIO2E6]
MDFSPKRRRKTSQLPLEPCSLLPPALEHSFSRVIFPEIFYQIMRSRIIW